MSSKVLVTAKGKLFALARQSQYGDYLGQREFLYTLVVAFLLHLFVLIAWALSPHLHVVDVPVQALNIKLGDGDAAPEEIPQPQAANSNDVENTISRLVRDDVKDLTRSKTMTGTLDKAMDKLSKEAAPKALDQAMRLPDSSTARQFVRSNTSTAKISGNSSDRNAEMISRYEQLISLWIQKFWVYPDAARAQNMQGETMVRIRIDRQGNIRYYILENSTGSPLLDKAAIDMVRRANPVPAVPADYPPGELNEFLIPVSFHLQ